MARWLRPGFWARSTVHADDRQLVLAHCALAARDGQNYDFVYRALTAERRVVSLHSIILPYRSPRAGAARLRGMMIDVTQLFAECPADLPRAAAWVATSNADCVGKPLVPELMPQT